MREGYSEMCAYLLDKYGITMTKRQVAEETHKSFRNVTHTFYGWEGNTKTRRIKTTVLARQLV